MAHSDTVAYARYPEEERDAAAVTNAAFNEPFKVPDTDMPRD
jgi:hypothetical protein